MHWTKLACSAASYKPVLRQYRYPPQISWGRPEAALRQQAVVLSRLQEDSLRQQLQVAQQDSSRWESKVCIMISCQDIMLLLHRLHLQIRQIVYNATAHLTI